jgi:hypothetical protein
LVLGGFGARRGEEEEEGGKEEVKDWAGTKEEE